MNLKQFFFAGYETTLTAIKTCFFVLVHNPDEARKLQDEIDSAFGNEVVIQSKSLRTN